MERYYCKIDCNDQTVTGDKIIDLTESSFSYWKESSRRENKYVFSKVSRGVLDLLYISSFVYLADCMSPREKNILNWERNISLVIPVLEKTLMDSLKDDLIEMLNFLSGDYWDIEFKERQYIKEELRQISKTKNLKVTEVDCVSMLSGGLDSLIGAIDLLESNKKVLFVGSHGRGASVKPYQDKVYKSLRERYNLEYLYKQFSLERSAHGEPGEITTRSRSFSFFAHGVAMADVFGAKEVIIPENGVISLNIPLTWSRIGSSSTRTTHPFYMSKFNEILGKLGCKFRLRNPYQFCTKGEMMVNCKNKDYLSTIASSTMSCSHPSDRYSGEEFKADSHCGYCVPCTIRRAAFKKSGIQDNSIYRPMEDKEVARQNSRSFKLGILFKEKIGCFDVLKSGRIPDVENYQNYMELYKRGVLEIKEFLNDD